ncbi:unnamed protein product [Dicrocoelium dendriticum]|nr:unnamed protein product [Dicrocoelium dendriticum]
MTTPSLSNGQASVVVVFALLALNQPHVCGENYSLFELSPLNNLTIHIRRGYTAHFQCGNGSTGNISFILWIKPDKTKVPVTSRVNEPLQPLILPNVSFSDSGRYNCTAYSINQPLMNATAELLVRDVPNPPGNVTVLSESPTSLSVSWNFTTDNNSPVILHSLYLFTKDKLVTQQNVSSPRNFYTFVGLEPRTCYNLVLMALNDVGWSILTRPVHAFTSHGKPAIQPLINLHNVSEMSAVIVFDHSDLITRYPTLLSNESADCGDAESDLSSLLSGFFTDYAVYVSSVEPIHLVNHQIQPVIPKDKQVLVISNLKPYTRYNISVAFRNGPYQGPMTQLLIRTAEDVPDPPVLVNSSSTSHSITLHWINGPNPGGVIIGYKLELYRCGANQQAEPDASLRLRRHQMDSKKKEFTFEELDPNACYAVRVAARTAVGFGSFSRLYEVSTDIPAPRPPDLVSVTFLNTNDILLNWTCIGLCATLVVQDAPQYKVCWFNSQPIRDPPSCLRTQSFSSAHQAFCNCNTAQKFQTTVLPWSIVQHSGTERTSFTVRSLRKRSVCWAERTCEQESLDSNSIVLDLRNAPASWRMNKHGGFKLDSVAIVSIVAVAALVFTSVAFAACFASGLKCMFFVCQKPFARYGSSEKSVGKYRRVVPLRLNKTTYKPIPRAELRDYVTLAHADNDAGFQAEFEAMERTVCCTEWASNVAKLPENATRNRYSNVLAYDHTRVILKEVGNKSDYINANYIDGYHRRAAYIATQGPIPATFDDFWLMVWEQASNVIVMISNFIERGRRKCDKYWPSTGQQLYGNISVRMVSETVRAFFTVRVFVIRHVRCKRVGKERLVYHYQYTDWRDFDVPSSPLPVLKFIEASVTHWSLEDGPIVVHCSAGVGRTGTYICIESLIRQLQAEQVVTIRSLLEHIRQQRMKLVQTEQQYAFIHDALREYVLYPSHVIRPTHFADCLSHLRALDSSGRSNLERQYELCVESVPDPPDMSRSKTLVGNDRRGSSSLYGTADVWDINSSCLHGYHMLSEYIVARHPSAGAEAEFWKMVWDENSSIIVCLSDPELPPFWPSGSNEIRDIGWLHVTYAGSSPYNQSLTRLEFLLTSDREDYALVCTLWRFSGWPSVELENTSQLALAHSLLDLASLIPDDEEDDEDTEFMTSSGPIVVVDNSGGTRVGTFCALRILINQFTHEFLFDVYFVFKMLAHQRSCMFQSHRDLEFIYILLQQYLSRDACPSSINTGGPGCPSVHGAHSPTRGLSSPNRLGSHCRRRTKVMVNHFFPRRHKTRLITNSAVSGGNETPLVRSSHSSVNAGSHLSLLDPLSNDPDDNHSTMQRSSLPSTGQLESMSRESSDPSVYGVPSLSGALSVHSKSSQVAGLLPQDNPRYSTCSLPTV